MRKLDLLVFASTGFLFLSGCETLNPETAYFGGNRVTTASANQMFQEGFEGFTDEELFLMLDPVNKGGAKKTYLQLTESERIEHITKAFRNANRDVDNYGPQHRSEIQDRLIAASNQRCNLYENN